LRKAELVTPRVVPVPLKTALVSILAALACMTGWGTPVWGQEAGRVDGAQSLGFTWSYSSDSGHILIGEAEQRRVWTLGVEYTHLLHQSHWVRWDYAGSLMPLFEESDPTDIGTVYTNNGESVVTPQTPIRVITVEYGPVGSEPTGKSTSVPLYARYGKQNTYSAAFSPLGARISALPRWHVQPSFALDLGFVVSARDVPVDDADWFNFMFAFGPGVQFIPSKRSFLRLEYIYRHTSNAGLGDQNPGVDQGVVRLTWSRRW
jgi:opacity protein-like surface antigen